MRSLFLGLAALVASTALATAQPFPPGPGFGPPPPPGFGPPPPPGFGPPGPPPFVAPLPAPFVARCWWQPGPAGPYRVCDRPDFY